VAAQEPEAQERAFMAALVDLAPQGRALNPLVVAGLRRLPIKAVVTAALAE
jgi:hypothetical protein